MLEQKTEYKKLFETKGCWNIKNALSAIHMAKKWIDEVTKSGVLNELLH